ncbi:E3 ubiquitin-protein ligase tom1 [Microbotryomycetes sp. JL201]|nr:E3 ubiquitin-protein ligase tom1 [Microbotryomycetes sp. JL201]
MTKIKRAPKRQPSTHEGIAALVAALKDDSSTDDELPALLLPTVENGWTWPRTDLQHWIAPLNRFDTILERVIRDYDLGSMEHAQTNAFTPRTKELLHSILAFEKILLEHSTNRKIYASFDRLNDLLHTTDLDILLDTLKLALRPAQQYALTHSSSYSFGIAEKRLLSLAQGWNTREYGLEMVDLASDTVDIPLELNEVDWQFYKKAAVAESSQPAEATATLAGDRKDKGKQTDAMEVEEARPSAPFASAQPVATAAASTPGPKPRASFATGPALATPIPNTPGATSYFGSHTDEGLTTVHLGNVRASPKSAVDLFVDAVETYGVPEPERLELLQKIRIAKSMCDLESRRTMLVLRLYAIAVLVHTSPESATQNKLLLYEPELIPQLAELVHPDRDVPMAIQAGAFYALDALAKLKSKLNEVASALNAGVSHGILMYVLRRTVSDLDSDTPTSTPDFIDSLFNLLLFFQTTSFAGNMIVGAGIVSMLVDLVKNSRRDRVSTVTKAVVFLDSLMYGYQTAFTLFISSGGLNVFVDRVKEEIDLATEKFKGSKASAPRDSPTGMLVFDQAALLKGLLRALQRLMQTSGTSEGLRNLIDSSLLSSVKKLLEHRSIFGSQLFALAINITATFVHNEPTSLTQVQEADVPETLYAAIEEFIPASIDVLQAIPNAIGALCLNAAGLEQFNNRPIIAKYFSVFLSEPHVKVLAERDNGNIIGGAIDELVRHHPTLKQRVLDAVMSALRLLRDRGSSYVPETKKDFALQLPSLTEGSKAAEDSSATVADVEMPDATDSTDQTKSEEIKENQYMTTVDVLGRFLEGLFSNMQHCRDFIAMDPMPVLLDLLSMPFMPFLAPATAAFAAISTVCRIMCEVNPVETTLAIVKQTRVYLDKTTWFWETLPTESRLAPLTQPTAESLDEDNRRVRDISTMLSLLGLLADVYGNLSYTHSKTSTSVLSIFSQAPESETLKQIGQFSRVSTYESVLLKRLTPTKTPLLPRTDNGEGKGNMESMTAEVAATATNPVDPALPPAIGGDPKAEDTKAPPTPPNVEAVQTLMNSMRLNTQPIFQAATKLLVHRRTNDSAHRSAARSVSKVLAQILKDNLHWIDDETQELSSRLSFLTLMLGATTSILFDDRPNLTGLQTLLLSEFEAEGGLATYMALYKHYEDAALELTPSQEVIKLDDVKLPIVHVFGGLKVALDLLSRLTSPRTVLEAPQTAILVSREKDKSSRYYFDPHTLLVKLRLEIVRGLANTWSSSWLRKSPPNVVRSLVGALVNIIKAEGEASVEPAEGSVGVRSALGQLLDTLGGRAGAGGGGEAAGVPRNAADALFGALAGGGPGAGFPGAPGIIRPPAGAAGATGRFQVDQTRVAQLVDMGFPRRAVETALTRCRNNVGVATEYLLSHPDLVGNARDEETLEAARQQGGAADNGEPAAGAGADEVPAEAGAAAEGGVAGEAGDAAAEQQVPNAPAADGEGDAAHPVQVEAGDQDVAMAEDPLAALFGSDPVALLRSRGGAADDTLSEDAKRQRDESNKQARDKLNEERERIKPDFLSRALTLAEDYADVVFDIKAVISLLGSSGDSSDDKASILRPLLADLETLVGVGADNQPKSDVAAAIRWRVIALLASDAAYKSAVESGREDMMRIVARYVEHYNKTLPDKASRPKWLATVMLVADSLIAVSEIPRGTTVLAEGEQVPAVELTQQGPSWMDERQHLFDMSMNLLEQGVSDRDTFVSTLRLLLVLTRDFKLATSFLERDGLRHLLAAFETEKPETERCRPYAIVILRHCVEDPTLLRAAMEREIIQWFSSSRSKVADMTVFMRGTGPISFRNVSIFLEAAKSTIKLVQADATTHYHVALVHDPKSEASKEKDATEPPADDARKTSVSEPATNEPTEDGASRPEKSEVDDDVSDNIEKTMHALMSEVCVASKNALAPVPAASATAPPPDGSKDARDAHIPVDYPLDDYYRTMFALGTLSELLMSYTPCRKSLGTFSTRTFHAKDVAQPAPAQVKPRASFVHFLLTSVIPWTSISQPLDFESKRRATVSHFGMQLVAALCFDMPGVPSMAPQKVKDAHATDTANIRKGVLDAIARAYKDAASSSEPTEVRYGRLLALSDLCGRLLGVKSNSGSSKLGDERFMQMSKLMLEKNFAVILTNAIADIDLNFPSVDTLINVILRPLEQLTKVVTKVGRSKNAAPHQEHTDEDESSESESGFDEEEEIEMDSDEEEAPDLYRNSALGMYEGELEPGVGDDAYMTGDSAEEFDEEDEMMEEMDDGVLPGSDVSDVSDDEDEDDMHGDSFDEDDDMGIDEDEDDDSHADTDDMEAHAEDMEMIEGEDGIMDAFIDEDEGEEVWVDEDDDEAPGFDVAEDDGHAHEVAADIQVNGNLAEEMDAIVDQDGADDVDSEDPDSYTDEEEMYLTGELEFDEEMTEQLNQRGDAFLNDVFDPVGRPRARGSDMLLGGMGGDADPLGRAARSSAPPAHPLLTEPPVETPTTAPSRRGRGGRGPEYEAWANNIEQVLGPGGVDTLQELLGAHGLSHLSGPEQLRVGIAPGPDGTLTMVIDPTPAMQHGHGGGHGHGHSHGVTRHAHRSTASAAQQPRSVHRQLSDRLNAVSDMTPKSTLIRWQEESKIIQGGGLTSERSARLTNHVINHLHGPARARAAETKRKEQEARAKREQAEKEKLERERTEKEAEKAEQERQETEAREAAAREEAARLAASLAPAQNEPQAMDTADDDEVAEVINLARSLAAGLTAPSVPTPPTASTPAPQSQSVETEAPEAVSGTVSGQEVAPPVQAEQPARRVTIMVHGREVDITDTGIDPEFLEALPDDMREEVISQHHREARVNESLRELEQAPTSINSEFLDALPPFLREEVLRQEREEQQREQDREQQANDRNRREERHAPAAGGPTAVLDELERRVAMIDQGAEMDDEDEAGALFGGLAARALASSRRGRRQAPATTDATKKAVPHREAIQLLDKSGLATLVRLLFFPQPLRRHGLQKVLVNLCENARTRSELINLLLSILQDGTRDVSAVDRSFSQMSLRATKTMTPNTPRRKAPETPGGGLPHFPGESVPNLIAQRCLEALIYLVSSNEQAPLFFLTEQELSVGLGRRASKKGKGKDKATSMTTYPIILLLGLLDRPGLLRTQSMMDSLTLLLSTITKTLSVLQKKGKAEENPSEKAVPTIETGDAAPSAANGGSTAGRDNGSAAGAAEASTKDKDAKEKEPATTEAIVKNPPQIAPGVLRLVVNILDAGECSSKTFQQTLSLIQNLSFLPEAREIISDELRKRAQSLADALIPDLDELHEATSGDDAVRGVTLAKFSPASSLQAKLLRILKTIDYILAPPKKKETDDSPNVEPKLTPEEEKVKEVFMGFKLETLWQKLGDCLVSVEARPDLLYLATVLLPLIESLMVVSKYVFASQEKRDLAATTPATELPPPTSMEATFLDFTDSHKKILNTMVKNNPSLLSGSFSILVHNPKVLEFENKRSYFFSRLHDRSQRQRSHYGTINVNVRRQRVFEDSYRVLQTRAGDEIKYGKLNVKFYDEEGVDAGGVTREWFSVLARQMFDPNYALFQPQAADSLTFQPNKSSAVNPEHLSFFKFVGRIIGKAIQDQRILEAYFSRSVYKHMLGKRIDHNDLESIDPEYHKSLVWMLNNDIEGVIDLTFSVERDDFGVVEVVDLIPNGRNIAVTNENKHDYVRLIADQRLSIEIKDQINASPRCFAGTNALLKGLYEIVPKELLRIFSEKELELLISGLPEIDVDEWRANTTLHNFTPSDPTVQHFWRAVRSFSQEERAKLLQFVSGSSRVPLEGFAQLQGMSGVTKFSIHNAGNKNGLPTAHTCFNQQTLFEQLDLGSGYDSYEQLRKALLTAITEGATGFGFA